MRPADGSLPPSAETGAPRRDLRGKGTADMRIDHTESRTLRFAADELRRFLKAMTADPAKAGRGRTASAAGLPTKIVFERCCDFMLAP